MRISVAIPILLATVMVAYQPTFYGLLARWLKFDEAVGHGFLVLGMIAYLVYFNIQNIRLHQWKHYLPALAPLTFLSLCWYIAYTASITIIQQVLIPPILWLAILCLAGPKIAKILFAPIAFLYFAIPIWDYLNDALVDLTVLIVSRSLSYSGIPALIEGNSIFLPAGTIIVGDGCSGLRYFIVGLTLSSFAALTSRFTAFRSAFILLTGAALSLLANWIRVYALVLIGHSTEMQSSLMKDHDYFGWLVFFLVISPLFFIVGRKAVHSYINTSQKPAQNNNRVAPRSFTLCFSALICGPILAHFFQPMHGTRIEIFPPKVESTWSVENAQVSHWEPTLPKPKTQLTRRYKNNHYVNAHIYAYQQQSSSEKKLLPYISSLFNKDQWLERGKRSDVIITDKNGQARSAKELVIRSRQGRSSHIIRYWFNVAGVETADYKIAKLAQAIASLRRKDFALVVILETECTIATCALGSAALDDFTRSSDFDISHVVRMTTDPSI
ncbi:MAG: EpsI family protein [Gammaproteobacteria bacterium]|nr:EpsI family protein [Gammaproteobacteria bacterium]